MKRKLTYNKGRRIKPSVINNPSKSINSKWSIEKWELSPTDFDEESEKWDNRELGCDESHVKLSDNTFSIFGNKTITIDSNSDSDIVTKQIDDMYLNWIKEQGL